MNIVADLQLHSKYSRAVSKNMVVPTMARWGRKKGLDLLATGDWTHSLWLRELKANLDEVAEGIYQAKGDPNGSKFLLSSEVSSIYSQGGKGRRVHTLIFAPNFSVVEKINDAFLKRGCNLSSDGRPIIGLTCPEIAEIVLSISDKCLVIPAHAWTPWFALYGSKSGFDSLEECFGSLANTIYAVETGLSSDPAMNWQIKELEKRAIVSFSDAHSPQKLGREATVFASKNGVTQYTYNDIYWAIAERFRGENQGSLKIESTIEFYPEEGKYHFTGHRACGVVQSPEETRTRGTACHVCGRPLTVGVMHRVDELADPNLRELQPKKEINDKGVTVVHHPSDATRPPYVMLVPLQEILAEVYGVGVSAKKVVSEFEQLTLRFGSELAVLLDVALEELGKVGGQRLAEAVGKVRAQTISISPGYDGEFGKVKIWADKAPKDNVEQMGLFQAIDK